MTILAGGFVQATFRVLLSLRGAPQLVSVISAMFPSHTLKDPVLHVRLGMKGPLLGSSVSRIRLY